MTKNRDVALALREISLLLQIEGKDKFKHLSYARAARSVTGLGEDIEAIKGRGELEQIPGIGKAIAKKIEDLIDTGSIKLLNQLRKQIPVKVWELDAIPDVGPKTIKLLYQELGITDLDSLEKALNEGQLEGLKGMGKKTVGNMRDGISIARLGKSRTLISDALTAAHAVVADLQKITGVMQIDIAGSLRRRRETIGDIDILVDAEDEIKVMDAFIAGEEVSEILAHGSTKSAIRTKDGLQIDLRIVPTESYGAGMQYFTGSVDHNVKLRTIGVKMGLRLNEYGLYKGKKQIAGSDEEGIYTALGLAYVPPELREDRGEIEAAQEDKLPNLIRLKDIRGD
ncbi:MAG: helix-hairpin-helix domain-containing protein, partial [Candidatus Thorarchaeota archaeon]